MKSMLIKKLVEKGGKKHDLHNNTSCLLKFFI